MLQCDPSGHASDNHVGGFQPPRASVIIQWNITQTVPRLDVTGAHLVNGRYQAFVGEKVHVQFKLPGNDPHANAAGYRWQVNGGQSFDSWEVLSGQNQSVYRPFNVTAYDGNASLSATFKIDGETSITWTGDPFGKGEFELKAFIDIIEPEHSEETRIGTMQFLHVDPTATPSVTTEPANAPTNWPRNAWQLFGATLSLPDPTPQYPNQTRQYRAGTIQFARVWRTGASGSVGSYKHLQLVEDDGKHNGQFTAATHGQFALDNKYPYNGVQIEGSSSSTAPLVFLDAPGLADLDDDQFLPFGQVHTINQNQSFKLYVMYRPRPAARRRRMFRSRSWSGPSATASMPLRLETLKTPTTGG